MQVSFYLAVSSIIFCMGYSAFGMEYVLEDQSSCSEVEIKTRLCEAMITHDYKCASKLICQFPITKKWYFKDDKTILGVALNAYRECEYSYEDALEIIRLLLERGVDPDEYHKQQRISSLHYILFNSIPSYPVPAYPIIALLSHYGANPNIPFKSSSSMEQKTFIDNLIKYLHSYFLIVNDITDSQHQFEDYAKSALLILNPLDEEKHRFKSLFDCSPVDEHIKKRCLEYIESNGELLKKFDQEIKKDLEQIENKSIKSLLACTKNNIFCTLDIAQQTGRLPSGLFTYTTVLLHYNGRNYYAWKKCT